MKKILLLAATIFCFTNITNAQAGQLDSSFGNNGIVTTDLGEAHTLGSPPASQILLQSDGSMYVVQGSLSKRHADGSIDSSFGVNGFAANAGLTAITPDGKLVILTSNYPEKCVLAQYNNDGSPDSSFSNNGKRIIDFNYSAALTVQKDGKIVVAGALSNEDSNTRVKHVSRYNVDGSLDKNVSAGSGSIYGDIAIAIQKDGRIVVADHRFNKYKDSLGITRYNTDLSLDKTFSSITSQLYGNIVSAAIQSDGKIVVAEDLALVRFNNNGSIDKSFADFGVQKTAFTRQGQFYLYSIALQSNGKIVIAGDTRVTSEGEHLGDLFTIARYNRDGGLDSSFSKNGIVTTNFGLTYTCANTVAIQSDEKIIAAGSANSSFVLARFNTNGDLDNTFNKGGKLIENGLSGNTGYKSVAVEKDGKIVAAGSKWNGNNFDFAVTRYNTDGSPDNTFSSDGIQTTDFASDNDYAKAVVIQKDGKIIVAGGHALARYNTDGSLDNTFSQDGKMIADSINIRSLAVQNDGKIVAAGEKIIIGDISYAAVARYNIDGSPDKTFGTDGKVIIGSGYDEALFGLSVVIQSNGKIVLADQLKFREGPYDESVLYLDRLNENGSIDAAFGSSVRHSSYLSSIAMALQDDDKIVIAGDYFDSDTEESFLSRVNADGSNDSSFHGINSYTEILSASSIAVEADGKIIVAGSNLYGFNTNGSTDSTFGKDGVQPPALSPNGIAISNNKLYIAGGYRYGTVARYLLGNDSSNPPPTITLTTPTNNATYLAPAAHIKLSAAAADKDGSITKVEFYNGATLLHTETVIPYGFVWRNVPAGNYTLTAKAYDNSGNVTTSAPVHISVVPNKAPIVSIITPSNNQSFAAPAYIHFEAAASDTDGKITKVEFYNGNTLLRTQYKYPYTYVWKDVPTGSYNVTAVATDNWGAKTTSAPVTIKVTSGNAMMVSNRAANDKTDVNDAISLQLSPNPATNIVNISAIGLQQSKPVRLSVISASGVVVKTMQISNAVIQLDVASLASGMYTVKIISGDKILYKQFVKM